MRIRLLTIFVFGLVCSDLLGQKVFGDYYPYHYDESILIELRDSLIKEGVEEIFVFQKNIIQIKDSDKIVTYVLWNTGNIGHIKAITDSFIYKINDCRFFTFFKFPNLLETAINDKFDRPYRFVTPCVFYKNRFIIYSNKQKIFTFQSGNFSFDYVEHPTRQKNRKKLADMIENEISICNCDFIKESRYKRLNIFGPEDADLFNKIHETYFERK